MNNKQVIVVRKDLNMRKGKMVAQGAHASLAAVLKHGMVIPGKNGPDGFCIPLDQSMQEWLTGAFKKICVSVNSEAELLEVHQKALAAGLHCALIKDSGLTEFGGVATYTTCAIGPNDEGLIDPITGGLPLL
jgi:PTH2 family peptidyl-tRNA hydrolase